jgi:hypothetical protein
MGDIVTSGWILNYANISNNKRARDLSCLTLMRIRRLTSNIDVLLKRRPGKR